MADELWVPANTGTTWDGDGTVWDAIPSMENVGETVWDTTKTTETWSVA
jgi:hypothetical protein